MVLTRKIRHPVPTRLLVAGLCLDTIARCLWVAAEPSQVSAAYIGPGAGIALLGSFLAVFTAVLVALGTILTWPFRRIWRALRGQKAMSGAKVKRVVIVGLDGLSRATAPCSSS